MAYALQRGVWSQLGPSARVLEPIDARPILSVGVKARGSMRCR